MMCLRGLKLETRELLYIQGEEDETVGLRDEAEVTWHIIENMVSLGSVMHALNAQQTSLHSNVQDERMKSKGWNREPRKKKQCKSSCYIPFPCPSIRSALKGIIQIIHKQMAYASFTQTMLPIQRDELPPQPLQLRQRRRRHRQMHHQPPLLLLPLLLLLLLRRRRGPHHHLHLPTPFPCMILQPPGNASNHLGRRLIQFIQIPLLRSGFEDGGGILSHDFGLSRGADEGFPNGFVGPFCVFEGNGEEWGIPAVHAVGFFVAENEIFEEGGGVAFFFCCYCSCCC